MLIGSGGYSNVGARGKNFQKLMLSEKKKRSDLGLHIFLPKSRCSLKKKKKKKRSSLPFALSFPYFRTKIRVFSKKKKKGLHSESSSEQKSAANPKLYVLFSRGGLRRLPHSPHPISTTVNSYRW